MHVFVCIRQADRQTYSIYIDTVYRQTKIFKTLTIRSTGSSVILHLCHFVEPWQCSTSCFHIFGDNDNDYFFSVILSTNGSFFPTCSANDFTQLCTLWFHLGNNLEQLHYLNWFFYSFCFFLIHCISFIWHQFFFITSD